ncbi:RICIN domain-containing protein [Streptomyces showdoensis]|uniref:RICIN domain-containing protein n=1 Tax=Streptomyces showdoensis TaxID=68268 RepID=UPI001040C862|nr:RICIN domain-containing protein [Streptomyces showdoensis]
MRLTRLVVGAALAASALLPTAPAAQAAPTAGTTVEPFDARFTLTRVDGVKTDLISAVESAGVSTAPVTEVLGSRTGRPGLCHPTGLNGALRPDGFCWDDQDDRTGYTDAGGGWMPQGFAGAHVSGSADGTYRGRTLFAASWYFGVLNQPEEYTRVSIAESAGGGAPVSYGHIALVEPVAGGDFKKPVFPSHADGVAWYKDRLFVANGAELQVYDLNHLWRMTDTTAAATGRAADGKSSARHHRWALPLVARYSTISTATLDDPSTAFLRGTPRACGPAAENFGELCMSSLSVDLSDTANGPALVSTEHRSEGGARIVRWPLDGLEAGAPERVVSYGTAYTSPVTGIQGIAKGGDTFYLSGSCPTGYPGGYACLHAARAGEAPRVLTQAPYLTQGLSYDPRAGRLWGYNEALENASGGRRVVFSVDPAAGAATTDGWGWLTNRHRAGAICATPLGNATANGTAVTVWSCTGSELQRWRYDPVNRFLVHQASGRCLTPKANGANVDGAVLTLWTCNPSSDVQRFTPDAVTGLLVNDYGKAIATKGNSLADGTVLTLWTKSTGTLPDAQDWSVKGF